MKNLILFFAFCFGLNPVFGQKISNISKIKADKPYDNIWVQNLSNDSLTSSFVIFVKDTVLAHKHNDHSEQIYVFEGTARMYLNNEMKIIKKGDVIYVPQNTWHAVKVLSRKPLKVLSVQSPYFDGKDRVLKGN